MDKGYTDIAPKWFALSHHDRCRRLNKVRRVWGRCHYGKREDRRGRSVLLNGTWINDVPSFYLALGEATNGPNGYFGGGLDALSDCLCGGFGVLPPLTIHLSHFEAVRKALDGRAWARFQAEGSREAVAAEAALAGEPLDSAAFGSYFDALVEVLGERGAKLVPDNRPQASP